MHDAVNNFHFLFNFATVCIKWKIYAQLHNKQTKYWKWTIHSHLQKKQAHNKVCYEKKIYPIYLILMPSAPKKDSKYLMG